METPKKIQLVRKRNFGDLFQDSIQFVVQHAPIILRGLVFYVGPFFLVSGIINVLYFRDSGLANLNLEAIMQDPSSALTQMLANSPNWGIVTLSYVLSLAVFVVMAAVINSVMVQYKNSPEGEIYLEGIWEDVKAYFLPYTGLSVLNFLLFFGVYLITVLLVVGLVSTFRSPAMAVLFVIPIAAIFYVLTVLPLTYMIRMHEGVTSPQAIVRAFRLIKGHWWQTFFLLLVMFVILYAMIFGLYGMAGVFALIFGEKILNLGALLVIGGLIGSLVSSLLSSVIFSAIGLQYFSLIEEQENPSDFTRIEEIGKDRPDNPQNPVE